MQEQVTDKLLRVAQECDDITQAVHDVLIADENTDITLTDGTKTPSLSKRAKQWSGQVTDVVGKKGSISAEDIADALELGTAAKYDATDLINEIKNSSTVESIADLRLLKPTKKGQLVYLISVNKDQGEGGGDFVATQKSGLVDDSGIIIASPDAKLFWVRINYEEITPTMFQAKGGDNDDYTALTSSYQASQKYSKPYFLDKIYRTSKPLEWNTSTKIKGVSPTTSGIVKYSASKTGITGRTDPNGNLYDYDQDCAVVFPAWFGWFSYIDISNISITKEQVVGGDFGKVFFAPYISMSTLKNVVVKGGEYGFYGEDLWMMNWTRCEAYSKCGFAIMKAGTSNTWNTCWSKETKEGYSSYRIHNVVYSTMTNCCAESVGEVGKPADAAYHITNSDLTMISCGIEGLHAYNAVRIGYSWVKIINPSFTYGIHQLYKHPTHTGLIDIDHSDSVVSLEGGRVTLAEEPVAGCVPVRINGGTFTYNKPLWSNVFFPDDPQPYQITVSNWAAILDLNDFTGRKYTFNGRGKDWNIRTKTQFSSGIKSVKLTNQNLNEIRKDIFFASQSNGNNGTSDNSYPYNGFVGSILNLSDGDSGWESNTAQIAVGINQERMFFRRADYGSNLGLWLELYTTANTTVDANGFIKKASPIIQLYADKIELNDEAKEQDIVFERVDVGHYLIKGSSGFADESWYIEQPKDANGNLYHVVEHETLESGDIQIKTFDYLLDKRGRIVADYKNPLDVQKGRWIDIRLNTKA